MRRVLFVLSLVLVACATASGQEQRLTPPRTNAASAGSAGNTPAALTIRNPALHFEQNDGQAAPPVKYLARARGYTLFLAPGEAVMRLMTPRGGMPVERDARALRVSLKGGNQHARVEGLEPLLGKTYYVHNGERRPLTATATFEKVRYEGVYPGIDLVYYGNERLLEFDFIVAPHADPDQIVLQFAGADRIELEKSGDLSVRLQGQEIRLKRPVLYQEIDRQRHEVDGSFVREGASSVRFEVGSYDQTVPLVIDPVIDFATYLGSAGMEVLGAVAVNTANEIYVAGGTEGPHSFPNGTLYGPGISSEEPFRCFVSKFSPDGQQLLYSVVYLDRGQCSSLQLDASGFIYTFTYSLHTPSGIRAIVETNGVPANFEIPMPWVSASRGFSDFRVSPDGSKFYVIGSCALEDTVALWPLNGFDNTPGPGFCRQSPASSQSAKSLLVVVDNGGNLLYGTFLAGSADTPGVGSIPVGGPSSLAVDDSGKVYVVGHTVSTNFPTTADALQPLCAGSCSDGYLTVIDPAAAGSTELVYSSFIGGDDLDFPASVVLDGPNTVLLTTASRSSNFPGAAPTTGGGVFMTRYSLDCGPPCAETTRRIEGFVPPASIASFRPQVARFRNGRIAVIGQADDTLPLQGERFSEPPNPGFAKAAVSVFSSDLTSTDFVSYLDDSTFGRAQFPRLTTDSAENLYVALVTAEGNLATPGAFQEQPAGFGDVWLFKLSAVFPGAGNYAPVFDLGPTVNLPPTSPAGVRNFEISCFTFGTFCHDPDGDALTLTWTGPFGTLVGQFFRVDLPIGVHTITLTADDGRGGVTSDAVTVHVLTTNVPASGRVSITLRDESVLAMMNNAMSPVTLTFANVTGAGIAYLRTRVDQNPPVTTPTGLQIGSPPMYYEVLANGALAFAGHVTLCVSTRGMSFANPGAIQLHRLVANTWVPLTPVLSVSTEICGEAPGLGTFAILYPQVPETQMMTIAGTGFAPGQIDGNPNGGSDSRDNYNEGGPATQAAFLPTGPGAVDRARGYLYFTASEYEPLGGGVSVSKGVLYRVDLNAGTLDRVAGNRVHPFLTDGPGGNPADDPIDGALALAYPIVEPGGVALDPAGNVYFTERISNASHQFCGILKYDIATLRITRVAGLPPGPGACGFSGDGGPARNAAVGNGSLGALAADGTGNLFLVDTQWDPVTFTFSPLRIRRVDAASGAIATVAGNGTYGSPVHGAEATQSPLSYVAGLGVDSQNHVLFLHRVQLMRIAPGPDAVVNGGTGETMTQIDCCVSSQGGYTDFTGDGQPITDVWNLGNLSSIAADGSLLINQFHRARRIEPGSDTVVSGAADEIIRTVAGFEYDTEDPAFGAGASLAFYNGDRFATNSSLGLNGVYEDPQGRILLIEGFFGRIRRVGLPPFLVRPSAPNLTAHKAILTSGPLDAMVSALDVNNGDAVRFRLTASNVGTAPATGPITLSDTLAPGLTFTGGDLRCSAAGQLVTCALAGPIVPGGSLWVDITTAVGPSVAPLYQQTTITNRVSVSTAGDTNPGDDLSAEVVLTVHAPLSNLEAAKFFVTSGGTTLGLTVSNGDLLRFRLMASNRGPDRTVGPITLRDTLPSELTFVAAGSDPRCSAAGQIVTCTVTGPIEADQNASVDINAQVRANAAAPGQSVSSVNVLAVSAVNDYDPFLNEIGLPFTIDGPVPPNLSARKDFVVSGMPLGSLTTTNGAVVGYRLTAYNVGDGATTGPIAFTDPLDPALTFVAAGSDPRCAAGLVATTWVVTCQAPGPLAAGQSLIFGFNVQVAASAAPVGQIRTIFNRASVATPNDSDWFNDTSFSIELTVENPDVTPPIVTPPQNIVVDAILGSLPALSIVPGTHGADPNQPASVAVANFLNGSSATDNLDPGPLPVTLRLVDCGNLSIVVYPHPVSTGTLFPVGTTCVRFEYRDAAGNIGSASASITVNPAAGGVVPGPFVPVGATDASNNPQPVTVTFFDEWITSGGLVQANPIVPPPAAPAGFRILGVAYNITTTVSFAPPVRVCFIGAFQAGDVIYHNGSPAPTTVSGGMACATVDSLSPFMVLRPSDSVPPVLSLPADLSVEATGSTGATVTFVATALDAVDGPRVVTCVPASGATFGLGTTQVSCAASDAAGNTANGSFRVVVQDTTPPVLTLPVNITTVSTSTGGAVVSYAASANDLVSGAVPASCAPASGSTFPLGTTTVNCTATDGGGSVSSGSFSVVVTSAAGGSKPIAARILSHGLVPGTKRKFVEVQLANTGDGIARDLTVVIALLPAKGFGIPRLVSPNLPAELGDLDAGAKMVIRVEFECPASVKQILITEAGTMKNVNGKRSAFLEAQTFTPQ